MKMNEWEGCERVTHRLWEGGQVLRLGLSVFGERVVFQERKWRGVEGGECEWVGKLGKERQEREKSSG